MNKTTLASNIKYLAFGLVIAGALSFTHADFALPSASAPASNIDAPLHTGPDQVKDGGLSVNLFLANQNAQFKQQTFLNGTVFGGNVGDPNSTVVVGDGTASANLSVKGGLSAALALISGSVANPSNNALCADAKGTIVPCGTVVVTQDPPSLSQKGPTAYNNNEAQQIFEVGPSVQAGYKYSLGVYSYNVTVTAGTGDNEESIVAKLVAAINNTTAAQWRSVDPSSAPANGTPGFTPSASAHPNNPTWIVTVVDNTHQFGANASAN
ncbi:MAG TPA: hypothetical protein VL576_01385 [Candidatus Paceibacterota bacterium]|jgi:hypothetical protein|nr:hypothetical protein [Candidatus Paceibacterota bacterium]